MVAEINVPWMNNPRKVLPQLLVALWGSMGYFQQGAVRAWSSPSIPSLNRTLDFEMSPSDFQLISSFPMLGAVIGSLLINVPLQHYGRKKSLVWHYLIFSLGFLITGFTYFIKDKTSLYVGRFLMGFANGCTTPASQIYVSECASPRIRGRLGSLTASSMALGVWVTYIIGSFVEWYTLSWIFGILPIIFLLGTLMMPETPSWLLANGREEAALRSLRHLRGKVTDIDSELGRMKEHQALNMGGKASFRHMFVGPVLKPLGISLGLMFFQQTTGANAIIFYTMSIFQSAGSTIDGRYATIIVGAVQLVFTVASGFLVDRCGRRSLFMSSAVTSLVPLTAMGTFFYLQRQWGEEATSESLGWLPLVSLIVFFITYSGGVASVPFIIMGEMFPSRFRPLLGAITSSFSLFCLFLTIYFFPVMMDGLGKDGTFFFYAGCTLMSVVFVYFCLPETKGKKLEEIERLFDSKSVSQGNKQKNIELVVKMSEPKETDESPCLEKANLLSSTEVTLKTSKS